MHKSLTRVLLWRILEDCSEKQNGNSIYIQVSLYYGSILPFPAEKKPRSLTREAFDVSEKETKLSFVFCFSGKEALIFRFLVFLFVAGEIDSRAHRFYYEIEESEEDGYENSRFRGACRAGEVGYNNGEIENDEYEMNRELCKVGFDKFNIEHEIAKRVYRGKEEYVPEIFCFENFVSFGVCDCDERIKDHNDECEIKAHVTKEAFKFCEKIHKYVFPPN